MAGPEETREQRDARLEVLLIELIDVAEKGDRELVEEFLRLHPEDEAALRDHLSALSELNLLEDASGVETPMPLATVDDFRLLKPLGRGGMGEVWLAEQMSLRRAVAIKFIRAGVGATERTRERFRREARAMALIDDPHVARVHGSGTHESGVDWIAMEYVAGRGLDEIFTEAGRDPGSLDSRTLIAWGEQIAGALVHAHEAGVIHRDIKPSNIRVRPDGRAVLIDFGLSRHLHEGTLSGTGDFVGSPHYAAPEQLSSDLGAVGPATDVYALALTLYEGLTGLRPFEGESTQEVFRRILQTDPPRPRRLSSRVSRDLETVLLTAMQKEPWRRYTGAGDFRDDLAATVSGRSIKARPESPLRRAGRWARRHPARASMAAFIVITVLGGAWVMWKLPEIRRLRAEERRWAVEEALDEGFTYLSVGQIEEARSSFREALELDPDQRDAMVGQALTLLEGRDDEALYAWLDARDRERPDDRLLALIRRIAMNIQGREGGPKVPPPFDAVESFFMGHVSLAAGRSDKAYEYLQNANLIAPESRPVYVFDFIQAAFKVGRADEAMRFVELARVRWPEHPVADFIEASLISTTDPARAERLLEDFVKRLPGSASAWMNLGLARFRSGNGDGAIEALRHGLEAAPHHDDMRYNLGEILYRSGYIDEAIVEFEEVIRSDEGHQNAWYGLGHCLLVLRNDPTAAMKPLRRAVELAPGDTDARTRLLYAARWCGAWEVLAEAATEALRAETPDTTAAADALRALVELGRPQEAASLLGDLPALEALAMLPERWARLAEGAAWKRSNELVTTDVLALIRIFRARGDHTSASTLAERLREEEPEERELECHAEIARSAALAAARDAAGGTSAWERALEHLEIVHELWTEQLAHAQPRLPLLPELAPIFDAEVRGKQLPESLHSEAAVLSERFAELHEVSPR